MDTIYSLLKRAKELKEKSQVDSITPEEVGKLHEDTLAYIASLEQSTDGLGIKKVYQSKSAMEADTDPVGTNGKALRYGQLVSIYDDAHADSSENGSIYAYQKPGWLLMGKVSGNTGLSVVQEAGDSATKVMSQAAVTRLIEESSPKRKVKDITSSTPYTDGEYLAKGAIGSLVGIEHDYTGRLTSSINLETGEVLECDIPTYHYVGYAALAEVVDDKYKVLAILDGDNEDAEHKAHIFFVATHKMNVVISGRYGEGWKIVKRNLSIEEKLNLRMRRLDGQVMNITSSTPYTDGNYLAKGAIGSLVGIEHDYTGRLTSPINLEAGEVLECVIPCRNYVGYAALAEVAGDKYRVLAILDGKEENGSVTKVSYTADKKMQVVVSGRFDKGWNIEKKRPLLSSR